MSISPRLEGNIEEMVQLMWRNKYKQGTSCRKEKIRSELEVRVEMEILVWLEQINKETYLAREKN